MGRGSTSNPRAVATCAPEMKAGARQQSAIQAGGRRGWWQVPVKAFPPYTRQDPTPGRPDQGPSQAQTSQCHTGIKTVTPSLIPSTKIYENANMCQTPCLEIPMIYIVSAFKRFKLMRKGDNTWCQVAQGMIVTTQKCWPNHAQVQDKERQGVEAGWGKIRKVFTEKDPIY